MASIRVRVFLATEYPEGALDYVGLFLVEIYARHSVLLGNVITLKGESIVLAMAYKITAVYIHTNNCYEFFCW